jgi:hypothetical protein
MSWFWAEALATGVLEENGYITIYIRPLYDVDAVMRRNNRRNKPRRHSSLSVASRMRDMNNHSTTCPYHVDNSSKHSPANAAPHETALEYTSHGSLQA